jgi:LPS sulfotransferase NodH
VEGRSVTYTAEQIKSTLLERGVERTYTVAFSVRSGSTMLSNILRNAGFGRPTEFFQYPFQSNNVFSRYLSEDPLSQILSVIVDNTLHGIFGSKVTHDQRARVEQVLRTYIDDFSGLASVLPNHTWVYLTRKEIIDQAVSLFIAEASGNWHIGVHDSIPSESNAPTYDFLAILSKVMMLAANRVNWDCYFSAGNRIPVSIDYRDLVRDPAGALAPVINRISGDRMRFDESMVNPELQRISDLMPETYSQLHDRFIFDFLRIGQDDDSGRIGPPYHRWMSFFNRKQWLDELV